MKTMEEGGSLLNCAVEYRGEGNANLVITIKDRGLVIRFPKSKFNDKCLEEKLATIIGYFNNVIKPRLGERFLYPTSLLRISSQELEFVKSVICRERPLHRCLKDIYYPAGILMPDLTHPATHFNNNKGPTLSIELKPKTGVLFPENCPHTSLCNFCLKQFYKLQQGATDKLSDYCPLDLFSGDKTRMKTAIRALLESPQNNLKIFGDGVLLHDQYTANSDRCVKFVCGMLGDLDVLPDLLVAALSSEYKHNSTHYLNTSRKKPAVSQKETKCDKTKDPRVNNCSRQFQQRKSLTCSRGISREVAPAPSQQDRRICSDDKPVAGSDQGSVLDSVLWLQNQNKTTDHGAQEILETLLEEGTSLEDIQATLVLPEQEASKMSLELNQLRNYVLYATAKDLSIFVTLQPTHKSSPKNCPRIFVDNASFCFSVKVIDLDPKPLRRISKYVCKKDEWLNSWENWQQRF